MGQDRQFTDSERQFILETIHKFRCNWEHFEKTKVAQDRDALIDDKKKDDEIITEEFTINQKEREENLVKAKIDPDKDEEDQKADGEEEEEMSFEQKQFFQT
jgi:hypothetical protein